MKQLSFSFEHGTLSYVDTQITYRRSSHDVLTHSGEKRCRRCGKAKSLNDFANEKKSRDGKASWCKRCHGLHIWYGIDSRDYDRLVEIQGGEHCAICGEQQQERARGKGLYVDHDHSTGAIRGLLCANCNAALGGFRDNSQFMMRAISYLTRPPLMIAPSARVRDGTK